MHSMPASVRLSFNSTPRRGYWRNVVGARPLYCGSGTYGVTWLVK
jgi:hypothetical protein